jgi:hypothetical protein
MMSHHINKVAYGNPVKNCNVIHPKFSAQKLAYLKESDIESRFLREAIITFVLFFFRQKLKK